MRALAAFAFALTLSAAHASPYTYLGTTLDGGKYKSGTIFGENGRDAPVVLYAFCALPNCADGAKPETNLLAMPDGSYIGTTAQGGAGGGVLFGFAPVGNKQAAPGYQVLARFCWYFGKCKRFGHPVGTLALIDTGTQLLDPAIPMTLTRHPKHSRYLIEGMASAINGRGVLWLFDPAELWLEPLHYWNKKN